MDFSRYVKPAAISVAIALCAILALSPFGMDLISSNMNAASNDPAYNVRYNPSSYPTRTMRKAASDGYVAGYYDNGNYVNETMGFSLYAGEDWNPQFDAGGYEYSMANAGCETKLHVTYLGTITQVSTSRLRDDLTSRAGSSEIKEIVTRTLRGAPRTGLAYRDPDGRVEGEIWFVSGAYVAQIDIEAPDFDSASRAAFLLAESGDTCYQNAKTCAYRGQALSGDVCESEDVGISFKMPGGFSSQLVDDSNGAVIGVMENPSPDSPFGVMVELEGVYADAKKAKASALSDISANVVDPVSESELDIEGVSAWRYDIRPENGSPSSIVYVYANDYLVKFIFRSVQDESAVDAAISSMKPI